MDALLVVWPLRYCGEELLVIGLRVTRGIVKGDLPGACYDCGKTITRPFYEYKVRGVFWIDDAYGRELGKDSRKFQCVSSSRWLPHSHEIQGRAVEQLDGWEKANMTSPAFLPGGERSTEERLPLCPACRAKRQIILSASQPTATATAG